MTHMLNMWIKKIMIEYLAHYIDLAIENSIKQRTIDRYTTFSHITSIQMLLIS